MPLMAVGPPINVFLNIKLNNVLVVLVFLLINYEGVQRQGKCDCSHWNLARIHPKNSCAYCIKSDTV